MNPIQLTQTLQEALVDYLTTIFDVNRDKQEPELASAIRNAISVSGALFNGPYLEIAPPYQTGMSLQGLSDEGVLSPHLLNLPCFKKNRPLPIQAPLYLHQESAIRKLSEEKRSVVVSSGTGSGKTECFLIPILNDLLIDPAPGVRAVLIYPLNALVNDQLDRLRVLLRGTKITFGRYTSELATTTKEALRGMENEPLENEVISREEIRSGKKLPQILITNYAMLEYLLVRPEDSILFQGGRWRFIVLDEAHTYSGAQGIEVAMLIRRLKHRLAKQQGEVLCIATSATLTNDDPVKAQQFAATLFDEPFEQDDIIFGKVDTAYVPEATSEYAVSSQHYLHPELPALLKAARGETGVDISSIVQRLVQMGIVPDAAAQSATGNPKSLLYQALIGNRTLTDLRHWMMERQDNPAHVHEAAEKMFSDLDEDGRLQALYRLIELGAMARPDDDKPSLLPARYHLFARPPQGIWVCLNPHCQGRTTSSSAGWSRMFSDRRETCDTCGCRVYPIVVCRECGQVYVRMLEQERQFVSPSDDLYGDESLRYFTWKWVEENRGLGEFEDTNAPIDKSEKDDGDARFKQEEKSVCLRCGYLALRCTCGETSAHVSLFLVNEIEKDNKRGTRITPVEQMNQCCRCFSKSMSKTEIVTSVSVGGVTPLSILTYELYRQLPPSADESIQEKPGEGRKLLTFYDNRQGAARFAAFLQDVVNTQNYRHIIAQGVRDHYEEDSYLPSVLSIADRSVRLAWEKRIFHNDPETNVWRETSIKMSREQREELKARVTGRLLAEFTTGRDERQSLEKLGVIGVTYFEEDNLPDFVGLANQIGFSPEATRTLVEYLLDDIRKRKLITFPRGVEPDDQTLFGRNISNDSLVRKSSGGAREQSWVGVQARHYRRRLAAMVLRHFNLLTADIDIDNTLSLIWDWLIDENTDLFKSTGGGGYQLKHERIFFRADMDWFRCTRCQRVYCHGDALPCPHPDCGGRLELFDISERQAANYFFGTYQRDVIPMRVEEHTAQLDSVKGRSYQDGFRDGDINALSCSTTFEMGIDLGDLQAVVMNNVPPTVANYRQRSGRAGRRTSGTAFILTWASARPHDQNYFRNPPEIIRGHVRVPHIALDNSFIRQRHINAVLLSTYLRYRRDAGDTDLGQVGAFFDPQSSSGQPHYAGLEKWLDLRHTEIYTSLELLAPALMKQPDISNWLDAFKAAMDKANQGYLEVTNHYRLQIDKLKKTDFTNRTVGSEAMAEIDHYAKLLDRLQRDYLVDYLSGRGVLPSYSFPLYTVALNLPSKIKDSEHLRLERDLRQAIREYAPGSEVVADKRIWRSAGLQFYRDTVRDREYRICPTCNNLQISRADGISLIDADDGCPVCHEKLGKLMRYVTPDGFRADPRRSGVAARQYVEVIPSRMRSGLIPASAPSEQTLGNITHCAYDRTGQLLYVNEGRGRGFRICLSCGSQVSPSEKRCKTKGCSGIPISEIALGHVQQTDTLHLRFESKPDFPIPSPTDSSFWLSLMNALIQGASRALQIERRDIDGVLTPRARSANQWEQTIVLYDNVPGGAGHVKQIQGEFTSVLQEALRIVNCTDCAPDTSCYHCLRDYNNQLYHSELRRGPVVRFLEILLRDFSSAPVDEMGAGQVIAANFPHWLMRQIEETQQHLALAATTITLEAPLAVEHHWLDLLHDLVQRKVEIDLYLATLPVKNAQGLSIARHLQVLMQRGLRLWQISNLPEWQVVIDAKLDDSRRAIRTEMDEAFDLDHRTGLSGLVTTIHPLGVRGAYQKLTSVRARRVNNQDLDAPANVQVINVKFNERRTEADLFSAVFAKPVKRMFVNDPYLYDHERIIRRLGAYIDLAAQGDALEIVNVITKKAGQSGNPGNNLDQERAENELNRTFGDIVKFKHSQPQHDRFIEFERTDGTKARIIIGYGLDFIQPDGRTKPTYIVIQDPSS